MQLVPHHGGNKEEEGGRMENGSGGLGRQGTCVGVDLYVAYRHEHFPMLHVRPAWLEDADDLMPIVTHSSSPHVKEEYGERSSVCE